MVQQFHGGKLVPLCHPTPVPLTVACLSPTEHVLEKSLHCSVLKPLRPILVARLRRRLSANSSLGRLAEGLRLARARGASAFALVPPPWPS